MIVKGAAETHWPLYFETNPADGLHLSYSAFNFINSNTIEQCDISNFYTDLVKANEDLKKVMERNPFAGYAVVPVL
jgi:hypothetical protein